MAANRTQRRIIKWGEMDKESRTATTAGVRDMGMAKSRAGAAIDNLQAIADDTTAKVDYRKTSLRQANQVRAVQPALTDKPITLQGAATRRVNLVKDATQRAKDEGRQQIRGAGWYFDHHKQIMAEADRHGFSPERAITATTALSPLNSPRTERKAGAAIMDMVGNQGKHEITLHPDAAAIVNRRLKTMKQPPLPDNVAHGKRVTLAALGSHHIAAIGSVTAQLRNKGIPVDSTADFASVGATRLTDEVHKGIQVLRGELHPDDVINPTAQKVTSYRDRTLASVPGSEEHQEYLTRTHHVLHHPDQPAPITDADGHKRMGTSSQGAFDLWGKRHVGGDHPVLGASAQTVEDSWQQAITTGQKLNAEGRSPAKIVAGIPMIAEPSKAMSKSPLGPTGAKLAPDISTAQAVHAFNVKATQGAAGQMPVSMGHVKADLPSGFVQETGWTEARIQAPNADKEYAAEQVQRNLSGPQFKQASFRGMK